VDLYLMQHGEAVPGEVDPQRPLSEHGRQSVAAVAGRASAAGVRIDRVVHSGKLRAEQTARILAEALYCTDVSAHSGLSPRDNVQEAAARLVRGDAPTSLAIVGHLPFLDRLAAWLVAGDPDAHVVAFHNGGLVHLVPAADGADAQLAGSLAVSWILVPELAAGFSA
jgi:phosphohistidine phosphatase